MNNLNFYSKVLSFFTGGVILSSLVGCGEKVPSVSFSDSSISSVSSDTTLSNTTSSSTISVSNKSFSTVTSTVTAYVVSSSNESYDDSVISYFDAYFI